MGLISPTQVTDGTTADASDVNNPINTIANEFNGNIDNANIKTAAAIDGTKIASSSITNTQMSTEVKPVTRYTDDFFDHVASGCVWTADAAGSTLLASMTAGVVYVSGVRATVSAITSRAFTASKDTYIDVDSTGAITYTEVANNAASPALSAGNVRIGIIVTGGTSIATANSVNQGQEDRVLPIASSIPYAVTDSLGNLICPRDPNRKILGYRQTVANQGSITTEVDITGLSVSFIAPGNRKVKVSLIVDGGSSVADDVVTFKLKEGATQLNRFDVMYRPASSGNTVCGFHFVTPSSGLHTYKATVVRAAGTGTIALASGATYPNIIVVELV